MECLRFGSEEALQIALKAGLVPPDVMRSPAKMGRAAEGLVEVVPSQALTAKALKALTAAGVTLGKPSSALASVSCWAEGVQPVRLPEPEGALGPVLFTLTNEKSLLELAGELLRLGCDRQGLRLVKSAVGVTAMVRVIDPPWYVLSRALDRLDGVRAFLPSPASQETYFTEVGWSHPLHDALEPNVEGLVLLCGDGPWWHLPAGEWTDVDQLVEPTNIERATQKSSRTLPNLQVTLSLARAARPEAPTLYVLDGTEQVEALVRTVPQAMLDNVLFAVADSVVVLRARPGRETSTYALPGAPYARVLELPNLFAPAGTAIEPPLRRDRLRAWLAPDVDVLTWLSAENGRIRRTSLLEEAFRPLSEWVDYVVDGSAAQLTAWAKSATFDFEPFTVAVDAAEPRAREASAPREEENKAAREPAAPKRPEPRPSTPRAEPVRAPAAPIEGGASLSQLDELIAREEAAFINNDAPAESPARVEGWQRLAELYSRGNRPREAGMAWAHVLWQSPPDAAARTAQRWAEAMGGRGEALLADTTPSAEQTRGGVAYLTGLALRQGTTTRLNEWVAFIDRFGDDLDVRSFWLAKVALSRLAGGDKLGLARARDRVLTRLQRGLSLDRDVPRLVRVVGQGGGALGTERAQRVSSQLDSLLKAFDETPRKRSAIEAQPALTRAYVHFEFAWAFARLGQGDKARAMRDAARPALDKAIDELEARRKDLTAQAIQQANIANPAGHRYLIRAYSARIEQAIEGASPEAPLPAEVAGLINALDPLSRYRVDRLRLFSNVLETQERLDPTSFYYRTSQASGRGEELAALRGLSDVTELIRGIELRAAVAEDQKLPADERGRLLDGLLDFLPRLPESNAIPLLQRLVGIADGLPVVQRALVVEDALKIAGHFGRTALVKQLVMTFGGLIKELGADGVAELGVTLVAGLRSLRRVGLRDEASELLARATQVLKGSDTKMLISRLAVATGFAGLGNAAAGQPVIDEALSVLARESGVNFAERLRLTRATARAIGAGPAEVALPGLLRLSQQLPWITDNYNTNDYFCLSVIDFADSLVVGHVGDDLTLNESARRFVEEDEYLVRRRVHRDVGETS